MKTNYFTKLFDSLGEHEIIFDPSAVQVFIWLMTHVDKETGSIEISRNQLAKKLKANPNTIKDVLNRLFKRYQMVSISKSKADTKVDTNPDTKGSNQITLLNWAKYQTFKNTTPRSTPTLTPTPLYELRAQSSELTQEFITNVITSKPLDEPRLEEKTEIKTAPVKKQHPYAEVIEYCKVKQNLTGGFVNFVKQATAVKKTISAGYSLEDMHFVIDEMATDPYWKDNPFDLMSVANNMHKYMNRTVYFDVKKGGKRATVS